MKLRAISTSVFNSASLLDSNERLEISNLRGSCPRQERSPYLQHGAAAAWSRGAVRASHSIHRLIPRGLETATSRLGGRCGADREKAGIGRCQW